MVEVVGVAAERRASVLEPLARPRSPCPGTARRARPAGPTSAINAFVFSVPSTITAPSSSPSRFDPQSPMNTDAGWKLKSRKPSAAPATIAASMPAVVRPRSNAMIENATAEIAHTPAASPSTPSEKFTTFISTTSPSAVTGAPRSPSSTRCTNGSVNASTATPEVTSTTAAATCPASLIEPVQVEHVVERADDRDQRGGGEDALRALVVGQEEQARRRARRRRSRARRAAASPRARGRAP